MRRWQRCPKPRETGPVTLELQQLITECLGALRCGLNEDKLMHELLTGGYHPSKIAVALGTAKTLMELAR